MRNFIKLLTYATGILFVSCATLTGSKSDKSDIQTVTITSNVSGAVIELDGVKIGTTPFVGEIKKEKEKGKGQLKVSKPEYISGYIQMKKEEYPNIGNLSLAAAAGIVSGLPLFIPAWNMFNKGIRGEGGLNTFNGGFYLTAATIIGVAGVYVSIAGTGVGFSISELIDGGASWEYSPSSYYVQLQKEGQSSLDFFNEVAIRYFSTLNHSQIAIDAGENNGEYANALVNLMETKMDRENIRQSINDALEKSEGNQINFSDELVLSWRYKENIQ